MDKTLPRCCVSSLVLSLNRIFRAVGATLILWSVSAGAQTVNFSAPSFSADNTNGQVNIPLVLNGVIPAGTNTVNVVITTNGTAVANVDFLPFTNNTVTFLPGFSNAFFPITLLNNTSSTTTQTLDLALQNPSFGLVTGTTSTAILFINNVSASTSSQQVQFVSAAYSAAQTDDTAVITLVRTGGSTGTVSVAFSTGDGSAKAGIDYVSTNNELVVFEDGVVTNTVEVTIIPSPGVLKSNQTVNLTLTGSTGAGLGSTNMAVLTILATSSPVIQFSSPDYKVHEHVGSAVVSVIRLGDTSGDSSVSYATSDGTAVNGIDYLGTHGTLSFASGDSSKSFSFQIVKFPTLQKNKTVNVTLSDPSPGTDLGTQDTAVVTIVNDKKQTITFTNGAGDAVTLTLQHAGTMEATSQEPLNLTLSATDATSLLTIKAKKAKGSNGSTLQIDQITSDGGCRVIDARDFDLVGAGIDLVDYLGTLKLHDILNGAALTAGGATNQNTTISAHVIDDGATINLGSRIASLTAVKIGNVTIQAPSIGNLGVRGDKRNQLAGDFEAQVDLTGPGPGTNQFTLGTFQVSGSIINSVINIEDGNVGSVGAAKMIDSELFVGYVPDDPADPFASGSFLPDLQLNSVNIGSSSNGFVNSFIAAPIIGNVRLRSVVTDNGGVTFGVLAGQSITSLTVNTPPFRFNPKGANDQSLGDFHVIH